MNCWLRLVTQRQKLLSVGSVRIKSTCCSARPSSNDPIPRKCLPQRPWTTTRSSGGPSTCRWSVESWTGPTHCTTSLWNSSSTTCCSCSGTALRLTTWVENPQLLRGNMNFWCLVSVLLPCSRTQKWPRLVKTWRRSSSTSWRRFFLTGRFPTLTWRWWTEPVCGGSARRRRGTGGGDAPSGPTNTIWCKDGPCFSTSASVYICVSAIWGLNKRRNPVIYLRDDELNTNDQHYFILFVFNAFPFPERFLLNPFLKL